MAKEIEGKTYLTAEEVKKEPEFGWSRDTLYRMRGVGLLKAYHFFGDRKTYWELTELRGARNKPLELNPKDLPVNSKIGTGRHNTAASAGTLAAAF